MSTFNTDYKLVKEHRYEDAVRALKSAGYKISEDGRGEVENRNEQAKTNDPI